MEKLIQHVRWDGDYHVWADTTQSMFKAYGLNACIEKDFTSIKDPTPEERKNEDLACFAIRIALPTDASHELRTDMSAYDMWKAIKAYYTREEEASTDAELDRFLSYRMQPHQEMSEYLSTRKVGWNKLKAFLPLLDECIYRYVILSGLQDLPDDMYKDTVNIIRYRAKTT